MPSKHLLFFQAYKSNEPLCISTTNEAKPKKVGEKATKEYTKLCLGEKRPI